MQSGRPLLGATHTISLGSLSALGITLLGRVADVTAAGVLAIADDLAENAAHADKVSADIRREIDDYIARQGLDAEPASIDPAEAIPARFPNPPIRELDLAARGITTVIWSVGFSGDYRWLRVPGATDAAGQPAQSRCLSVPGVYFAGIELARGAQVGDDHGCRRRVAPDRRPHRGGSGASAGQQVKAASGDHPAKAACQARRSGVGGGVAKSDRFP